VAASTQTAAALHAVMEARGMELAGAGQQALPDAATQQLHAHMQQLVYQLADASAAPGAVAQAANAGQQVMRGVPGSVPLSAMCLCIMHNPVGSAYKGALSVTGCTCHAQAGSGDWLSPVADGLQTVLVFIQSGLEQVRGLCLSSSRLPLLSRMLGLPCMLQSSTTSPPNA